MSVRGREPRRAHTERREPAYGYSIREVGRTVKTMRDEIAKGTENKHCGEMEKPGRR